MHSPTEIEKNKIEHKGLEVLAELDIRTLVFMAGEQEAIELVTNLMSGQAEGERGEQYVYELLEPYL